jgi:hypothetical protein
MRLPYVLGERFTGYTGGAMWHDAELGISHPLGVPLSARADAESWVTA